jgi:hypothetical protein
MRTTQCLLASLLLLAAGTWLSTAVAAPGSPGGARDKPTLSKSPSQNDRARLSNGSGRSRRPGKPLGAPASSPLLCRAGKIGATPTAGVRPSRPSPPRPPQGRATCGGSRTGAEVKEPDTAGRRARGGGTNASRQHLDGGAAAAVRVVALRHQGEPHAREAEAAEPTEHSVSRSKALWDEVRRGLSSRISLLGFGVAAQPVNSALNPNNILKIPRYVTELDLRPDFNLNFRQLELSVKPRLELFWQKWEDGVRQGNSKTDSEVFIQEWLARIRLTNQAFVSYGRENLQWGPSYLLSPSNPFNRDNGQNNPRLEVPGLDYGRAVWIPSSAWTVSFIANTDEGRSDEVRVFDPQPFRDFKKTYAAKLDYTGEKRYFSLIPSYREGEEARVGFFGGWTVSEAFLLHIEGSLRGAIDDAAILVGGAYTLELGPTITVEFYHDGEGCTLKSIVQCFVPGFGNSEPADILIRQNYLLMQYTHTRIRDSINLTLRWIRDLDDDSNRVIGIFEYDLSDRTQLFTISNVDVGNKGAEFGSLLNYSVMAGVRFTL